MKWKIFVLILLSVLVCLPFSGSVLALEDGTYKVSNSTSYANPDSGKTDDGGSNMEIGDAMARSMTQQLMLYEMKDEKQYLTIRIGLQSYSRDIRISVQGEKNKATGYQPVPFDVVRENKDTDTAEYRFEVESLDLRVRITFFVGPMNRDVIFFITPDPDSVKSDNGAFAASDKASNGYGSGFAGGLTGGNAEEGKLPALVEQLTRVSQTNHDKNETGSKEAPEQKAPASQPRASEAVEPTPDSALSHSAGKPVPTTNQEAPASSPVQVKDSTQQVSSTQNPVMISPPPAAAGEAGTVKELADSAAKEQMASATVSTTPSQNGNQSGGSQGGSSPQTSSPAVSAAASPAPAVKGMEEKVPSGSTAKLADQGLTQFDREGKQIREPAPDKDDPTLGVLPVAGGAAGVLAAGLIGYVLYIRSKRKA